MWLAPEQVRILPISDPHVVYAEEVAGALRAQGVRVTVDAEADTIGAKIRRGRNARLPYMLIVGERERENQEVSIRRRGEGEVGTSTVPACVGRITREIEEKC